MFSIQIFHSIDTPVLAAVFCSPLQQKVETRIADLNFLPT